MNIFFRQNKNKEVTFNIFSFACHLKEKNQKITVLCNHIFYSVMRIQSFMIITQNDQDFL